MICYIRDFTILLKHACARTVLYVNFIPQIAVGPTVHPSVGPSSATAVAMDPSLPRLRSGTLRKNSDLHATTPTQLNYPDSAFRGTYMHDLRRLNVKYQLTVHDLT